MKLRKGYVSNSSTTSFCIYGARVPDHLVDKYGDKIEKNDTNLYDYYGEIGDVYIGNSYESMGDNQTKAQFEEDILIQLKDLFGEDYDDLFIGVWSESYRNG